MKYQRYLSIIEEWNQELVAHLAQLADEIRRNELFAKELPDQTLEIELIDGSTAELVRVLSRKSGEEGRSHRADLLISNLSPLFGTLLASLASCS